MCKYKTGDIFKLHKSIISFEKNVIDICGTHLVIDDQYQYIKTLHLDTGDIRVFFYSELLDYSKLNRLETLA